jgi:hypothetical protein
MADSKQVNIKLHTNLGKDFRVPEVAMVRDLQHETDRRPLLSVSFCRIPFRFSLLLFHGRL